MNYKIQITVDEQLNTIIKARATQMGLSVSSYARLALVSGTPHKKVTKLLDQGLKDMQANDVEALNLDEFQRQIDDL